MSIIQTCIAREADPKKWFEKLPCQVYACEYHSSVIIEVGGGMDGNHTSRTTLKLCKDHAVTLALQINNIPLW